MSAFWDDEESPELLDEDEVFDLVGSSLEHLHMGRSLEQITVRGYMHHRRRAAVTAMASVAAVTALGAAVAFAQSGNTVRAVSTASGTASLTSTTPRMTDPDWTVAADPAGGYAVDITALGDVDQLNATLKSLGVELNVVEAAPSGTQSACPTVAGATGPTTASTPTTSPSTAMTSPDAPSPTPTPVTFAASGVPAAFTFGALPRKAAFSFVSTGGRSRPLLGTVRISDDCLPVFGTQP